MTDPDQVAAGLADLTGAPTGAFFRTTAMVGHGELEDLDRDEATLRERLAASISAADRSTTAAIEELQGALADLNTRAERDPGRLGIAEEAVARSQAAVDAGAAALNRLVADRTALADAEDASTAASGALDERRNLLDQARDAEALSTEQADATERQARYEEAVAVAAELNGLNDAHPSPNPLPVVRQTVERLRALSAKIAELTGILSGEVKVDYEVTAASSTWRQVAFAAIVIVLVGLGLAAGGRVVTGLRNLEFVGTFYFVFYCIFFWWSNGCFNLSLSV